MSGHVILRTTEGELQGHKFVVPNGVTCVIGRSRDCNVQLPWKNRLVSRHHCRLNVDWPTVHVLDLDSMNGTYINGFLIGRREKESSPLKAQSWTLKKGDFLRVGETVFRVELEPKGS
jgi:pSer/pThr/pTyr-binding forkhead associated (FHA) protein